MTAVAGSRSGSGATSTSPPPKRRRRDPVRELPDRAEPPVRVDSAAVRTEGAVVVRCFSGAAFCAVFGAAFCAGVVPLVGGGAVAPFLGGAMPQVSQ
jgi:hypothetical protein